MYLGLDVAKLKIDICLLSVAEKKRVLTIPNSTDGFDQLLNWLDGLDLSNIHACLEPTGTYSRGIAFFLFDAGISVSLVNSFAVLNHGRSKQFRSKNDRIDAYLLADYGLKHQPPVWMPPTQTRQHLQEMQHRLDCIDEAIRQEENRLEANVECKLVREDIEENLGRLYVSKKKFVKELKKLTQTDERLSANFTILKSIIGLGDASAIRLLSVIHFEEFKSGRQVGCYAGLSPREHESGTSVYRRCAISKVGNAEVRAALYFPAMVAMQHNPQMRDFSQRLREKGKAPKVVICAVMRKLLSLAHSLIRKQQMYDPAYCNSLAKALPLT
jgi:transposase